MAASTLPLLDPEIRVNSKRNVNARYRGYLANILESLTIFTVYFRTARISLVTTCSSGVQVCRGRVDVKGTQNEPD